MKTFLITGVSTGLGRALAEAALAEGHRVVGTVRNEGALAQFEHLAPGRAFARQLEVTDVAAIGPSVQEIESRIGPIDVLVNNAGYGHEGTFEESSMDDLRHQFNVNVYGPVALMQAVLPGMRQRRSGHIINITSMGGLVTVPGLSFYHGSKFALEGISESLGKEVAGLGIFVTAVEPGSFRTDWAGRSMVRAERGIADYDAVFDPIRRAREERNGRQPGDPALAARAILKAVAAKQPPAHLLLGSDANKVVRQKLDALREQFDAWQEITLSTDFPK